MSEDIKEIYQLILSHLEVCETRFREIKDPPNFITESGNILLDAIAMRLQAAAENIKKVGKHNPSLKHAISTELNNLD